MVESITYKYINGNLAQEYAANWKVESQNLPSGSTIETSEVPIVMVLLPLKKETFLLQISPEVYL